jgi:hypothetical protein
MNLHNKIMNLPCKDSPVATTEEVFAYRYGHKDARHAAAELALTADDQIRKLREALELLYFAYCDQMRDQYDFPGNPWTPDRYPDAAAIAARAAIKETEA